jgi:hypothetical protein
MSTPSASTGSWPTVSPGHRTEQPRSEARARVEDRLKSWGLAPGLFAPEISEALATPLTSATLEAFLYFTAPDLRSPVEGFLS